MDAQEQEEVMGLFAYQIADLWEEMDDAVRKYRKSNLSQYACDELEEAWNKFTAAILEEDEE